MIKQRSNFHIHSNFSDGKNSIAEITRAALELRMNFIAITDHFSNSWKAKVIRTIYSIDSLCNYVDALNRCQEYLIKIDSKLVLLKGLEVDLYSSDDFIERNIEPKYFNIILFEYLESIEGISFLEKLLDSWRYERNLKQLPLIGLAHFDPSVFFRDDLNILVEFLSNYNIFYEFNESYPAFFSKKYEDFFAKIRKENIPISIGCDSHDINTLYNVKIAENAIQNYALSHNYDNFIESLNKHQKECD